MTKGKYTAQIPPGGRRQILKHIHVLTSLASQMLPVPFPLIWNEVSFPQEAFQNIHQDGP